MFVHAVDILYPYSSSGLDYYKLITICTDSWHTLTEEKQLMLDYFLPTQVEKEPIEVKLLPGKSIACKIALCTCILYYSICSTDLCIDIKVVTVCKRESMVHESSICCYSINRDEANLR